MLIESRALTAVLTELTRSNSDTYLLAIICDVACTTHCRDSSGLLTRTGLMLVLAVMGVVVSCSPQIATIVLAMVAASAGAACIGTPPRHCGCAI
eukprot:5885574-Pyramimonas_sp.AAC.2